MERQLLEWEKTFVNYISYKGFICRIYEEFSHTSKVMLKILQARLQQYVKFHMFKLDLEKAEELEIELPISSRSLKKQESSRKTSTFALLTMSKLYGVTLWITINWKILQEMGIPDRLTCLLRNQYASQETTVRIRHGRTD